MGYCSCFRQKTKVTWAASRWEVSSITTISIIDITTTSTYWPQYFILRSQHWKMFSFLCEWSRVYKLQILYIMSRRGARQKYRKYKISWWWKYFSLQLPGQKYSVSLLCLSDASVIFYDFWCPCFDFVVLGQTGTSVLNTLWKYFNCFPSNKTNIVFHQSLRK